MAVIQVSSVRRAERSFVGAFTIVMITSAAVARADEPPFSVETATLLIEVVDEQGVVVPNAWLTPIGLRSVESPPQYYLWPRDNVGDPVVQSTDLEGTATIVYPRKYGHPGQWNTTAKIMLSVRHPDFNSCKVEIDVFAERGIVNMTSGPELAFSAVNDDGDEVTGFGAITAGRRHAPMWRSDEVGVLRSRGVPTGARPTMLVLPSEDGRHLFSKVLPLRVRIGQSLRLRHIVLSHGIRIRGRLSDNVPRQLKLVEWIAWCLPKPGASENDIANPSLTWGDTVPIADDGSFEFPSLPTSGKIQFVAICRGWVIQDRGKRVPPGGFKKGRLVSVKDLKPRDRRVDNLVLAMEPTGSLEVTVIQPDGSPLPGADVSTSPYMGLEMSGAAILGAPRRGVDDIRNQFAPPRQHNDYRADQQERYRRVTDERGRVILHDIPLQRRYSITVAHREFRLIGGPRFQYRLTEPGVTSIRVKTKPVN